MGAMKPVTKKTLVKLRAFKIADMNQILEVEEQAFPKTPYSREILLAYTNSPTHRFVVLEENKHLLGYIIYSKGGHVISMAVKQGDRRKGFGKILFRWALEDTEERLWLEVRSKNDSAIRFYESMGMETIGNTPGYYGDDDALILTLQKKQKEREVKENEE